MTTSLYRLDAECGEPLRELGFAKIDDDGWWRSAWMGRPWWRPVWAGYPPSNAA